MPPPLLLFAHGAGAGPAHPWMQSWTTRLSTLGSVIPFEYPYMAAGRRSPDRLPKLIEAHREALHAARKRRRSPVYLVGKSMGSRVGCHLSLEESVDGIVCFGYPLKGMGKKAALRDEVLVALETRILFVQGTRDNLCPLDLLAGVRDRMKAPSELLVVDDGDHSLQVAKRTLKKNDETQDDVDACILDAVREFVTG
jgi:predicted alpha/beta-hydrolase family hydrolase